MKRDTLLTVYAPASSGNLSVGFDALGLALAPTDGSLLGDRVSITSGEPLDWALSMDGPFAHALPQDQEQNDAFERRLVELARMAGVGTGSGKNHGPWHIAHPAPQFAIYEVGEAAKEKTKRRCGAAHAR